MIKKQTKQDISTLAMLGMIGGAGAVAESLDKEGHRQTMSQGLEAGKPSPIHLPSQMGDSCRLALTAAGVVFGKQVEGDKLFLEAALPAG